MQPYNNCPLPVRSFLLCFFYFFSFSIFSLGFADENFQSRKITLQEVIERAKEGPDARAAASEADKAYYESQALWRATFFPKVVALAMYDHSNKGIALVNPLAEAPLPASLNVLKSPLPTSQDLSLGRIEVIQSLLDFSLILYANPAAHNLAEAAKLKAAHDVKETQEKAISYYLQVLELRAKRSALETFIKNLQKRRSEIQRLYELGGVSEVDLLKVKLGIDDSRQGVRELLEKEELLAELLGQVMGERAALMPEDLPANLPPLKKNAGEISESGEFQHHREDIAALSLQIKATQLQIKANFASMLPRIEAFAGYTYLNQKVLTENNWADVGLRLTWLVFDGAVRNSKGEAMASSMAALQMRKESAEIAIEAQAQSLKRLLNTKRQEYLERIDGAAEAKKAVDLDYKRLRQGKITVNSVLDSADMLKDRQEKVALSKIAWYREWFHYQGALGNDYEVPK